MIVAGVDVAPRLAQDADSRVRILFARQLSSRARNEAFSSSEEQMENLQRHAAEPEADSSSVIPWAAVKAERLQRIRAKRGQ